MRLENLGLLVTDALAIDRLARVIEIRLNAFGVVAASARSEDSTVRHD